MVEAILRCDTAAFANVDGIGDAIARREYPLLAEDQWWQMQTAFAEAMHLCAQGPQYLRHDGKEQFVIAKYLRGVELLSAFVQQYLGHE